MSITILQQQKQQRGTNYCFNYAADADADADADTVRDDDDARFAAILHMYRTSSLLVLRGPDLT